MTDVPATEKKQGLSHSTPVEWAVRSLTSLSGIALAVILVTTFVGVVMRYFFHAPILGSNEVIQLVSIALIMLAMPAASQREEHVRVDVFDEHIGPWGRFIGDLFSRAVGVYLMYLLGSRSWIKLEEAIEFNDLSNMLLIPYWPFYGLMALGCALFAIVMILQIVDIIRTGSSVSARCSC
jgi:TRAP-type C4-dicarboxylate transport system permease small subunit